MILLSLEPVQQDFLQRFMAAVPEKRFWFLKKIIMADRL